MGLQGYTVVLVFNVYFIYYLFLAVLDLGCCTRLSLVVVLGFLIAEMGAQAPRHLGIRNCGSQALEYRFSICRA